jgi:hypothetical protein
VSGAGGAARVRRPEDVTPAWLSSVLAGSDLLAAGGEVASLATCPVGTGQMADTVRIAFTTADGSERSVVAKFASADEGSRTTGVLTRAYEVEVGFYRELAARVEARVPGCYHAEREPDSGWFVVVLEDVADGVQGEQLDGCSVEVAEAALVELAGLHGPTWSDPVSAGTPWLQRGGPSADRFLTELVTPLWPAFVERYGDRLAPDHRALGDRFVAGLGPWLARRPEGTTVVHGDFRLDNLLFRPGDPRPVVVDWQTAAWGSAAADVGYFLGGSLLADDRRRHTDRLLDTYHRALVERGVAGYPRERLDEDVRLLCFSGLLMSIGASMLVRRTERGDAMFVTSVERYAAQALDLGADELLEPVGRP